MSRSEESRKQHQTQINKMRGLTGMAMGLIYLAVGVSLLVAENRQFLDLPKTFVYIIGIACIPYGLFRIWRGWNIRQQASR